MAITRMEIRGKSNGIREVKKLRFEFEEAFRTNDAGRSRRLEQGDIH